MKKTFVYGKKVGVIGLGRSGIAAANLAKSLGAQVLVSETRDKGKCVKELKLLKSGVDLEFGGHSSCLLASDYIIKSPGVPGHIALLQQAHRKKIPVWSEIEFAARLVKPKRTVAITGTNGKTTTTALAGEIFKKGGKTVVAGNIGAPLASQAGKVDASTSVVLELSSYQLEDSPTFHPQIAAILNITPDHMEHHGTMKNYIRAKANIFKNQTDRDYCVLNYDDLPARRLAGSCPAKVLFFSRKTTLREGVSYTKGSITVAVGNQRYSLSAKVRLPGMHNIENVLAAVAMAAAARISPAIIEKVITTFKGVEHRIEFTAVVDGVEYFNDSKGTNVDSTRVALESFDRPVWLLLGGRDKGSPYAPLRELIEKKVRGILLIGEAAAKIKKELAGAAKFYECGTMAAALATARQLAQRGDIVLLSPACASFDQYKDYEDRGRQFKKLVHALK
jgi:UDP-N-acetylmuramoylalanine--D-glutamate ligase